MKYLWSAYADSVKVYRSGWICLRILRKNIFEAKSAHAFLKLFIRFVRFVRVFYDFSFFLGVNWSQYCFS